MTAARKLAIRGVTLEAGHVERIGAALEVRLFHGRFEARRAKSCLVAPEAGDKVLCAIEPEGVYVLAVLDGREGAPTKIATGGDLEVQAQGGRVAVCASERVDIVGAREVAVTGAEVHVRAAKGSIAIEQLGFLGRLVQAEVTKIALVARDADAILTRLTQRVKRVFRFIEEIDQTRAGTIDLRAQSMIGIRGENAVISARVLAKVDGEQIHLG